jgi:hypothetical protein
MTPMRTSPAMLLLPKALSHTPPAPRRPKKSGVDVVSGRTLCAGVTERTLGCARSAAACASVRPCAEKPFSVTV